MAEGRKRDNYVRYLLGISVFVIVALIVALILVLILPLSVTSSDKCYTKAAVAADAATCSEIGRDMLNRGGSAVDAAIAALLCVSLFNPHSMGIGGGVVFMIYNASTGKMEIINAKETAPKNASENMFGNGTEKAKKGLFIGVPGELRGYQEAHNRHGRLPWKELFKPSINLLEKGIPIGKALARAIKENENTILNNAALCKVFCSSNKAILKENDNITSPNLTLTYKKIAEANDTADVFYNGSLTQTIVNDINAAGGIITREDLENYEVEVNEYALNFTMGKYIFHAPGAPFAGPLLALILNILKGYNLSSSSVSTIDKKILTYHRIIETFRFTDVQKHKLGDPRDENIKELVLQIVKNITSDSFANDIRNKIKDDIKENTYSDMYDNYVDDDLGTSHLSIIAEDGSAVAVTSSINNFFGSKVMSESTGIIFNDQMRDFTIHKQGNGLVQNNLIKPGKRPRSSMCPTIILDKDSRKVKMVVGGSGGANITTSIAQVILNYLFFDYDLKKAVEEPRVQIPTKETNVEDCFDVKVTDGLKKKKNHTIFHNTELSVVQAVVRQGNKLCAESDCRKGGYPAGY